MSKLIDYIKRGIRYVIKGQPNVKVEVCPRIATIPQNLLLDGRTALITGATRGIGYAIADYFLKSGASVIITSRSTQNVCKAVDSLKKKYPESSIYGYALDISNIQSIKTVFDDITKSNDQNIDILVNNAGINGSTSFGNQSEEEWNRILNTNLKGTYFLSEYVVKYMILRGIEGNILNISSSSSIRPAIDAYMETKWALRGFTLGLAKVCAPHNIVVNAIAPGPTMTDMSKGDSGMYLKSSPISRLILPEEIANMAVIMVSNMGRSIIGDTLYMTGGVGITTFDDIKYEL